MNRRHTDLRAFILALLLLLITPLPFLWYGMICFRQQPGEAVEAGGAGVREAKLIALTFDDGPNSVTTPALLDGLNQRGVSATFFLIGSCIDGNEELVLRMDRDGHQVGIHSATHRELTGLNRADFYAEVGALRSRLESLLGHDSLLLRPPYGLIDEGVQRMAEAPIILWSIDPEDWSDRDSDRQVAHIVSRAGDGDIILLHDIYPSSVDTALRVVDTLLREGFYFVTIDQLFEARGIPLTDGQVYLDARR